MQGRPLSLSREVQAALTRGDRESARKLVEKAIAVDRLDAWDIEVAKALLEAEGIHGGLYEDSEN